MCEQCGVEANKNIVLSNYDAMDTDGTQTTLLICQECYLYLLGEGVKLILKRGQNETN